MQKPPPLTPGFVLAQRYRLERPIGEGGMGVVWAARHVVTEKAVALKFLRDAGGGEKIKRFMQEARIAGTLRHPNIVEVHDVFEVDGGAPVMVMDLLDGEPLESKLNREGALPLQVVADVMVPVVSAVGSAHARGVVHRDLKPDNIFLAIGADGGPEVKVLDFGIAKLTTVDGPAARTAMTQTGQVMGTPYYMSPEQVFGERGIDHRADLWAIGVILYECLSGRRPVGGENYGQIFKAITMGEIRPVETLVPGLPADVAALIRRLLQRDRTARPNDAREVFDTLRAHTSVTARSFGAPGPMTPSVSPPSGPERDAIDPYAHTATPQENPRVPVEPGVDPFTPTFAAEPRSAPIESGMGHVHTTRPHAPASRGRAITAGIAFALVAAVATVFALRLRHPTVVASSTAGASVALVNDAPLTSPSQPLSPSASVSPSPSPSPSPSSHPHLPRTSPPTTSTAVAPPPEKRKLPGGVAPESPY